MIEHGIIPEGVHHWQLVVKRWSCLQGNLPQNIPCSYTAQKNNYEDKDKDLMNNRIEPSMLNAFKSNPYTQPLDSYAWN